MKVGGIRRHMEEKRSPTGDENLALEQEPLSRREQEIATLYAEGSTYKEIAEALHRSPATVRSHLSTIFRKLSVSNKAELIRALGEPSSPERVAQRQPQEGISSPHTARDKPTIVVLPFDNISEDPTLSSLCDGISEDITTELSRFSNLSVIARNSAFQFKAQPRDIGEIAEKLRTRYLLEGSLRVTGSKLRLTAQLLDSQDATHVWAEKYDCDQTDIHDEIDFLIRAIVCNISPRIELSEIDWARQQDAGSLSDYALAMKALAHCYDAARDADQEHLNLALETYDHAVAQNERNVLLLEAHAMTLMYRHIYAWSEDPQADLDAFHETAENLVRLDSNNAKSYLLRAWALMYRCDFDAAVLNHHLALDLNPNLSANLFAMAWTEAAAGLLEEAETHTALGLRLCPREIDIWIGEGYAALAVVSFLRADHAKVLHYGHLANQKQPFVRTIMLVAYHLLGDAKGAASQRSLLEDFAPNFMPMLVAGEFQLFKQAAHNDRLLSHLREALAD